MEKKRKTAEGEKRADLRSAIMQRLPVMNINLSQVNCNAFMQGIKDDCWVIVYLKAIKHPDDIRSYKNKMPSSAVKLSRISSTAGVV